MPTTTVTITNATGPNGTVTLKTGQLSGERGRTITLEATAISGYEFEKWEIETRSVQLSEFARASRKFDTAALVCLTGTIQLATETPTILYNDDSKLYTDPQGLYPLATGYYRLTDGRYIDYTGNGIPTKQTCTISTVTNNRFGSGGGGINPQGGIGFGDQTSMGASSTVSTTYNTTADESRFI